MKRNKSAGAKKKAGRRPRVEKSRPQVLTIAGSDSGGGAGIQGDIKSIEANGAYGLSVITSITAQNTRKTMAVFDLPLSIIDAQLQTVFADFKIAAIKTGMLASKSIVQNIAAFLSKTSVKHLVIDPVMRSKSGYPLLKADAVSSLISDMIPLATLLTPNIKEAEMLAKMRIKTLDQVERAAIKIAKLGCPAVLIKGGHLAEAPACDFLLDHGKMARFEGEFIDTPHTHGTGCSYSAAIAAQLALGKTLRRAIIAAKRYITQAIGHPLHIGHGHGPINHFYFLSNECPSDETD